MEQGTELKGAGAVIEKDLLSGKLAELINADTLLILTSVEKVGLDHDSDHEKLLDHLTVEEAEKYMEQGQFEAHSMLPKFQAGVSFVENGQGRKAVITDIANAKNGYLGRTGTIIE